MADKKYKLQFGLSDGTTEEVEFTAPQGEKGDKGDKGDTGVQGEKGEKGDKGDKGDNGSDASVTKASIENALGYSPADKTVSDELVATDTLVWDRNPNGLQTFDMMGEGTYMYYKVADNVLSIEDFANGVHVEIESPAGDDVQKSTLNDFSQVTSNLIVSQSVSSILFALEDNAELYGKTIPSKGIYFMGSDSFGYVTKITIPEYTGFKTVILKEKHLPNKYVTMEKFKEALGRYVDDVAELLGGV